jgi:hypothetical protein
VYEYEREGCLVVGEGGFLVVLLGQQKQSGNRRVDDDVGLLRRGGWIGQYGNIATMRYYFEFPRKIELHCIISNYASFSLFNALRKCAQR